MPDINAVPLSSVMYISRPRRWAWNEVLTTLMGAIVLGSHCLHVTGQFCCITVPCLQTSGRVEVGTQIY